MLKLLKGEHVTDGAGVHLHRVIGTKELDNADPFLLLDEFRSNSKEDYCSGFPMHPHRGFETITYMIEGSFAHRDSKGNEETLKPGEVQWMTAGRGIIHEEMPAMEDGQLWGYQLWVNLPAKYKMTEPRYQHLSNESIPVLQSSNLKVKIISGDYKGTKGPIKSYFPVDYFDVYLRGESFHKDPKGINLVYVHTGTLNVRIPSDEELQVTSGSLCLINTNESFEVFGSDAGFLFLSADPLNEPIARYGPFVMNTMDEIIQAVDDNTEGLLDKE